jgi:UV DNA damage repair endonuclease
MRGTISWKGFSRNLEFGLRFLQFHSAVFELHSHLSDCNSAADRVEPIGWHLAKVGNTFGASAHFLVPVC